MRSEPEGLRITAVGVKENLRHAGLVTRFPLTGDFEVVVGYEFIHLGRPRSGYGAGFELYLMTDTPTHEALGVSRMVRPNGLHVYACSRNTYDAAGKCALKNTYVPANGTSGRLRLTRRGTQVVYWAAEGEETAFREIHRCELGDADVKWGRAAAFPGQVDNTVDVRIKDFAVRHRLPG